MLLKEETLWTNARNTKKINDVSVQTIIGILEKGFMLLGIKGDKIPDDLSLKLIVSELKNHYIGLTIGELDLAFTLAARGKLDYDNETYQSFSVLYLNRMLSAYARWAANYRNIVDQKEMKKEKQIEYKMPEDDIIETSLESYKKFKQWWSIFNCLSTFKILYSRGLVGKNPKEILKITEEAMQRRINQADPEDKKDLIAEYKDDDIMELYCRRMDVALYFDNLIKSTK